MAKPARNTTLASCNCSPEVDYPDAIFMSQNGSSTVLRALDQDAMAAEETGRPCQAGCQYRAAENQAYTLIGSNTFTDAAGQLRYASNGVVIAIGNSSADFRIDLTGTAVLVARDFYL